MNRAEKRDYIESMHGEFQNAASVVVTHYQGLSVAEITELRNKVREAGAKFRVTKNTLTKRALEDTPYAGVNDLFTGPTAVAYSEDPVAAAKAVVNYAKDNEKLIILGGALGEKRLEPSDIQDLSKMPSLDELRAKLVGLLSTPATRVAQVLQAPGGQVARVVNAYAQTSN